MKRVPLYVLEGAWDKPHEAPQVLPYFAAYAQTYQEVDFNHRTFRCLEDIEYYIQRLPKSGRAFIYFACHGEAGKLIPGDGRKKIERTDINEALSKSKLDAIGFVHFGCCSFVHTSASERRKTLESIRASAKGVWASGYTRDVDWLSSTLLDLALISEIYVPWRNAPTMKAAHAKRLKEFTSSYEQLARALGLSALSTIAGTGELFPRKVAGKS